MARSRARRWSADWRPIEQELLEVERQRGRIDSSGELTPLGKQKAIGQLRERGNAPASHGQVALDAITQKLTDVEAVAAAGMVKAPNGVGYVKLKVGERTVEALMLERELRDRLLAAKPYEVERRYLDAVRDGSHPLFVSAVENAPRACPLITDEVAAQAREVRIQSSPWAATVNHLRSARDAYAALAEAAAREVAGESR